MSPRSTSLKGDHSALGGEVRRYTKRDLRAKLERNGFHVKRLTYTNASLFPITATVRVLQRLRGVKADGENRGDFYVPPAPINALFTGALALESKIIEAGIDMPVGSSLLCLAKKPPHLEQENREARAISCSNTEPRGHERCQSEMNTSLALWRSDVALGSQDSRKHRRPTRHCAVGRSLLSGMGDSRER